MLEHILVSVMLISCSTLVREVRLEIFERDFNGVDVFQATQLDTYQLRRGAEMQKLNDLLIERTSSDDPNENLDIVLKELNAEQERTGSSKSQSVQAKRLILALRTLKGKDQCSYYAVVILRANLRAIGTPIRDIIENEHLRRVDEILAHCIKEYLDHCKDTWIRNYDHIFKSSGLDEVLMQRANILLERPIQQMTSDEFPENEGKTYIERIYNLIAKNGILYEDKSIHVYNVIRELVKGKGPYERFVKPVEDCQESGVFHLREDKFAKLHEEYVAKPCKYIREIFGPDVFEPYLFQNLFEKRILNDRVDFYETCLKYRLCYSGIFGATYRSAFNYAESLIQDQ